jgi:2,4-dienoyl-CoA reductase (NADPH2)
MEAARRLATMDHEVELWEASERLGGRLALGAQCDGPLDRFLGWLRREVERSEARVELGVIATSERVAAGGFDDVVVATGASWTAPELEGAPLPFVMTVDTVAPWLMADDGSTHDHAVGPTVVVVGGGKVGLSLADFAARRGRTVTVLESTTVFGSELGLPGRFELVADLEARGVNLRPACTAELFEPGCIVVRNASGQQERVAVDAVIIATPAGPDRRVALALDAAGIAYREIGDCRRFGLLEGALLDASELTAPTSV